MDFEFATPQNCPQLPRGPVGTDHSSPASPWPEGLHMGFFLEMVPHQLVPSSRRVPLHCSWAPGHLEPPSFRPLSRLLTASPSSPPPLPPPPRRRPQTPYPYPPCRYRSHTVKRPMATRARQRPSFSYVAVLPHSSVFVVLLASTTRQLRLGCQGQLVVDSSDPRSEAPREAPASGPSPSTSPRLVALPSPRPSLCLSSSS